VASSLTQAAEAAIGADAADDYVISPTLHADRYQDAAPALSGLIRRTRARVAGEEFERADAIAIDAQRAFKRTAGQASLAAMATAWLSALVLLSALMGAPGAVLIAAGSGGAVTGALGAFLTQRLRQQNLLQRWMSARAKAEEYRRNYFDLVTLTDPPEERDAKETSLFQLEYFRRYQLDVQVRYYDVRQRRHRIAADRTVTYAAGAGFFAALSAGLAGLLGASEGSEWAGLAALGIVGTSLATYATVRDSISQDASNAERYEHTRSGLREISLHLDEVREAVSVGNRAPLHEFVAVVHEQLAAEHQQWLSEDAAVHSGIARLEEALRGPGANGTGAAAVVAPNSGAHADGGATTGA